MCGQADAVPAEDHKPEPADGATAVKKSGESIELPFSIVPAGGDEGAGAIDDDDDVDDDAGLRYDDAVVADPTNAIVPVPDDSDDDLVSEVGSPNRSLKASTCLMSN